MDRRERRVVAAVEPDQHAWMIAQQAHLVARGVLCDLVLLVAPFVPALPHVAAAPAGHNEDAVFIGHVVERLRLKLALEANGVETKIAHVAELGFHALGVERSRRSGAQPPPRMSMGLPLILNSVWPLFISEVTWRTLKVTSC